MKYLPPFDLIRRSLEISTVKGELRVSVPYEEFLNIIRMMIAGIDVDEAWYARVYEDIGAAVRDGKIASAKQHFVSDGYIEGRKPFEIKVDEKWYFQRYPDVAEKREEGHPAIRAASFRGRWLPRGTAAVWHVKRTAAAPSMRRIWRIRVVVRRLLAG